MKVALVYDRINKWGGAERILLSLHEIFPNAPLFTSVYSEKRADWAKVFDVKTSFLQKYPYAKHAHDKYVLAMPFAFESFDFSGFDLVISVTSEAAKGIITTPKTRHICYCLTPTRYLWSGYEEYFNDPVFKLISKPAVSFLRHWDKMASKRPDAYIAISKEVQSRIKKYYGRDSKVIYPPVGISDIKYPISNIRYQISNKYKKYKKEEPFFLIVSRLVPYKRIDLAIKAFNKLKLPLKIVGTGSEEKKLKKIAGPTIEFLNNLTDEELLFYYNDCQALVFPANEDFGLTVLEAQLFGKPVIAFKGGGALETVLEDRTGIFFYPQTEEALLDKIREFKNLKFDSNTCKGQGAKFNKDRFKKEFLKEVERLLNKL